MIQYFTKEHRGFTLIELLVVIAIIGILASIVLVSLGGARAKARDARRQSDIRQISLAMEMYYDEGQAYLTSATMPTTITNYLPVVPKDPQGASYGWITNVSTSSKYCTFATLEAPNAGYFAASHKGTKQVTTTAPTLLDCW
ncbi:MAG: prepilin-type N-terminal cleavage/methylation domain-containing protein [Candidatus Nealsonbacteria bacterium]|nr:prepilin-type N-terminal cleavage/methylation domain-containing protein [Candidatus Nealsonbacteria bacterium]